MYINRYNCNGKCSDLIMTSDGEYLTGLWFDNTYDDKKHLGDALEKELPIFIETKKWLDIYFSGEEPSFTPKYKINNISEFRKKVINIIKRIPYGQTIKYGDIAKQIAEDDGIARMSSQAVGNAVGWNPICIIIPCHRVVGANNNLVGYGGGIKNKIFLLNLEHNNIDQFIIPKKGTKL